LEKRGFFYGYVIVAASFLVMGTMWGTLYTFGVFFKYLLEEFGWTRAGTSGALALASVFIGLMSTVTGRLTDRYGPRVVITVCGVFLGAGFLLLSRVSTLWQWYLFYGAFIGVGVSGTYVPVTSTIARWFVKRRGMMTGAAIAGLGAGTLAIPPAVTWLIPIFGWRTSYIIVGIIALVLVTSVAQLFRHNPVQMGLKPYGEPASDAIEFSLPTGFTFWEAIHTSQFWVLCATWFLYCLSIGAVVAHIVLHGIGLGLSTTGAALILSFIGAFSTGGRIVLGGIGDRFGYRKTIIACFVLMTGSLFWLLGAKDQWMLYVFGAVFGFSYGGNAALFSPFVAEQFGLRSHGVILGVFMLASGFGEAASPIITGYIFDITKSYYPAFLTWAVLTSVTVLLMLLLKPVRKRESSSP